MWKQRKPGLSRLPPAWDYWVEEDIVGVVLPSMDNGCLVWHAHKCLQASEMTTAYGSLLGERPNLDDAKRLVVDNYNAHKGTRS